MLGASAYMNNAAHRNVNNGPLFPTFAIEMCNENKSPEFSETVYFYSYRLFNLSVVFIHYVSTHNPLCLPYKKTNNVIKCDITYPNDNTLLFF